MAFPIARLLRQTCSYQEFTGVNNRDDATYASPTSLACRVVEIDRERYATSEDVRQAQTQVWLAAEPVLRSLINGREVIEITALVGAGAAIPAGFKAILR